MAWLLWLAAPAAATAVAAVVSWLLGRPPREPDAWDVMRAHETYLDTLGAVTGTGDRIGVVRRGEAGPRGLSGPHSDGG